MDWNIDISNRAYPGYKYCNANPIELCANNNNQSHTFLHHPGIWITNMEIRIYLHWPAELTKKQMEKKTVRVEILDRQINQLSWLACHVTDIFLPDRFMSVFIWLTQIHGRTSSQAHTPTLQIKTWSSSSSRSGTIVYADVPIFLIRIAGRECYWVVSSWPKTDVTFHELCCANFPITPDARSQSHRQFRNQMTRKFNF